MYFSGVLAVMRNEDEDEDVEEDATSVRLTYTTEALRGRCQGGCGLGGTPKPNGSVKSLQVEHAVLERV